jgi:hypothetical protein
MVGIFYLSILNQSLSDHHSGALYSRDCHIYGFFASSTFTVVVSLVFFFFFTLGKNQLIHNNQLARKNATTTKHVQLCSDWRR